MRSSNKQTVSIQKIIQQGDLPGFLPLIHRHFQKANPATASNQDAIVNAPVDLLEKILPPPLLTTIDAVEVHYKKRG